MSSNNNKSWAHCISCCPTLSDIQAGKDFLFLDSETQGNRKLQPKESNNMFRPEMPPLCLHVNVIVFEQVELNFIWLILNGNAQAHTEIT